MKKLIAFLIFVVILVTAPLFIGMQAETKIRAMYATMADYPGYELTFTEYHKGWFSSEATVQISLTLPAEYGVALDTLTMNVKQHIQHGPILWQTEGLGIGLVDIDLDFTVPNELLPLLPSDLNIQKGTFLIGSRMAFNSDLTSTITLQPFVIDIDNAQINVKAGEITSLITANGVLTSQGFWQGINVIEDDVSVLEINDMTFSGQQEIIRGELFSPTSLAVGNVQLNIDNAKVLGATPEQKLSVKDVNVIAKSSEDSGLLLIDILFNAQQIEVIGEQFSDFNYQLSVDNINIETFRELQTILLAAQELPEQERLNEIVKIQGLLPDLLAAEPVIKVKQLAVKSSDGDLHSDLTIAFNKDLFDQNNPMSMFMVIDATAKGSAPFNFFKRIGKQQEVDLLMEQNVLVHEQDTLSFSFTFKNGQALLNGQPVPLG